MPLTCAEPSCDRQPTEGWSRGHTVRRPSPEGCPGHRQAPDSHRGSCCSRPAMPVDPDSQPTIQPN